jgi:hypothetical protein
LEGGKCRKDTALSAKKRNIKTDLKETEWTGVEDLDWGRYEACKFDYITTLNHYYTTSQHYNITSQT